MFSPARSGGRAVGAASAGAVTQLVVGFSGHEVESKKMAWWTPQTIRTGACGASLPAALTRRAASRRRSIRICLLRRRELEAITLVPLDLPGVSHVAPARNA